MNIRKIIRNWPAYSKVIENKGINPKTVKYLSELPVVDKQFISTAIHMIPLFRVRNIIPSSGSTGDDFSFGLFGDTEMKKASCTVDTILKERFHAAYKKTLLINMLPGAISLQSSVASVASTGVRTDTALSVIKSLGSCFDQLILAGEPLFMKNIIEPGAKESIPWKHIPLYIIIGGEWTPLGYGNYLEGIAGPQRVYSFMGMAELGLCYFYETDETILLRKILSEDRLLRQATERMVRGRGVLICTFVKVNLSMEELYYICLYGQNRDHRRGQIRRGGDDKRGEKCRSSAYDRRDIELGRKYYQQCPQSS
jgi:phenylacetate-coenzyme A ligase PaaK-like adenylate-forming protein